MLPAEVPGRETCLCCPLSLWVALTGAAGCPPTPAIRTGQGQAASGRDDGMNVAAGSSQRMLGSTGPRFSDLCWAGCSMPCKRTALPTLLHNALDEHKARWRGGMPARMSYAQSQLHSCLENMDNARNARAGSHWAEFDGASHPENAHYCFVQAALRGQKRKACIKQDSLQQGRPTGWVRNFRCFGTREH